MSETTTVEKPIAIEKEVPTGTKQVAQNFFRSVKLIRVM